MNKNFLCPFPQEENATCRIPCLFSLLQLTQELEKQARIDGLINDAAPQLYQLASQFKAISDDTQSMLNQEDLARQPCGSVGSSCPLYYLP